MGHTIIDCRMFIKTTRGIIPLVLGGSNNCYDIVRGEDFKLRELRERYWSVLLDLVELPEEEILAKFENLIPDNSIECWVYNGKWLNGAQAQKWFARGVKDAAPLEDILSSNPGVGHLLLALMSYASSERLLERQEAEALYRTFGKAWRTLPAGWRTLVLSSHTEFERCFGRPADKKRKLYNGMIKCDVFMYGAHL